MNPYMLLNNCEKVTYEHLNLSLWILCADRSILYTCHLQAYFQPYNGQRSAVIELLVLLLFYCIQFANSCSGVTNNVLPFSTSRWFESVVAWEMRKYFPCVRACMLKRYHNESLTSCCFDSDDESDVRYGAGVLLPADCLSEVARIQYGGAEVQRKPPRRSGGWTAPDQRWTHLRLVASARESSCDVEWND